MRRSLPVALAVVSLASAAFAQTWQPLKNPPPFNASTMFLLMDGRVLVNEYFSRHWWTLTPDANGSYLNGKWTQVADSKDDRLYFASSVLADGRMLIGGGEYSNTGGGDKWEIYDPVANSWKSISGPSGWGYVGDAPSLVLADGRFFVGNILDSRTALYDPKSATWAAGASVLNSSSTEETWTLLPDGTVLSEDCFGHPGAELYDTANDAWVKLNDLPVDLVDSSFEIGPGMMLNNGKAFIIGATSHSARYVPSTTPGGVGTWEKAGRPPIIGGSRVSAKDAPACLLVNGHVLCALGHGFSPPTYFAEYTGTHFRRTVDPGNNGDVPYNGRLLPLPSGEALFADNKIELYTPVGGPDPAWAPTVTDVATDLIGGADYLLSGTQLNGLSQANSYGDECGVATNYPLVRLVFAATGHVVYCRAHDPSTMAVATGTTTVTTRFQVPTGIETGEATLEVVANGIASAGTPVIVRDAIKIGFDSLASGVVVTTQYAEATFSAPTGFENRTDAKSLGTSAPNVLRTGPAGGALDGLEDTYVDFPCPVASLAFVGAGIDDTGTVASVNVLSGTTLLGSVALVGKGTPSVPLPVDLRGFKNVTRIEITSITDTGGIAWDDFEFCLASSAARIPYGQGFPGTLGIPSLTASADPELGAAISVDYDNSLGATTTGLVLLGVQSTSITTSRGATILVVPLVTLAVSIPAGGDSLADTVPNDDSLCGVSAFLQVIELDGGAAGSLSFTPGLQLTFGH